MSIRGALAAILCSLSTQAGPGEYEVKAAFLYNFALYVEWPASALENRPAFTVASVGPDVFAGSLERTMKGRTAHGKKVEVVRFPSADDVKPVHILFVPAREAGRLGAIAAALKGSATLIVSEVEGAARRGAMLNLYLEEKRVRIEVNPDAAAREGLRVGAKVLRLSRIVKD